MSQPRGSRWSLLVVEDSPADVFLVKQAIREAGLWVDVHVVDDGEKAIRLIENVDADSSLPCPNVLLLDLNVPKRTGDEVLQRFRESQRCHHIPVVIMTSSESRADHDQAIALGATEYFRKPSSLDEFMRLGTVVKRLFDQDAKLAF